MAEKDTDAESALRAIHRKVYAHNRGGDVRKPLREEILDICERVFGSRRPS